MLNLGLRRDFSCNFTVADVPHGILGADFLVEYGLLPDLRNACLIDPLTGLSAQGSLDRSPLLSISSIRAFDDLDNATAQRYKDLLKEFEDLFEPSTSPVHWPSSGRTLPAPHR